jgi:hypothetical protein
MSDDALYRAQGHKTGGVRAMPQPLIVQCLWYRFSFGHFSDLRSIWNFAVGIALQKDKRVPSIFNDESTESFICL